MRVKDVTVLDIHPNHYQVMRVVSVTRPINGVLRLTQPRITDLCDVQW
jgi:hypothetical protein